LAAQFVFNGHFISKFSVLSELIEYLPTASDFGVIFYFWEQKVKNISLWKTKSSLDACQAEYRENKLHGILKD